jgi:hypothetical protein
LGWGSAIGFMQSDPDIHLALKLSPEAKALKQARALHAQYGQ